MKKGCELFVEKFLPNIKTKLAQLLIKEYGLTQSEVAKLFGLSQATISAGLNKKTMNFKPYQKEIDKIIQKILKSEDFFAEMCNLCKKLNIGCK